MIERSPARLCANNSISVSYRDTIVKSVMSAHPGQKNPYRPGAAVQPVFLAGRDQEVRRFRSSLRASPELPANIWITGLRGVGKSVLLQRMEAVAVDDGWLTSRVQVEPRHNSERELTRLVEDLCTTAQARASRVSRVKEAFTGAISSAAGAIKVSWQDIDLSFGTGDRKDKSLARTIYDAAAMADRHGYRGYLLMLDEAQVLRDDRSRIGQHPLSLLIAAVNGLQASEIPISLMMCGLPTLRTNLMKARTYAERMFRGEEIDRLTEDEAAEALERPLDETPVTADGTLVERVVDQVECYPFFIQVWGAELWEAAQSAGIDKLDLALLDAVEPEIHRRLDIDFYDGRVESLTPAEQDLLMATAQCPYPPLRTADIHAHSGRTESNVNVLMGRLAEQGIVFRVQKGQYEYTAPRFRDYLQRRALRAPRRH